MSKIRDEVRESIAQQFYGGYCEPEDRNGYEWACALSNADQILSKPEIAVVDREAEAPKVESGMFPQIGACASDGYSQGIQDMLKEGWVKEVKD